MTLFGCHGRFVILIEGKIRMTKFHEKPIVTLVGSNGNAFAIVALARRALVEAGDPEGAKAFVHEAMGKDFDEVLRAVLKYCDVR